MDAPPSNHNRVHCSAIAEVAPITTTSVGHVPELPREEAPDPDPEPLDPVTLLTIPDI
ncbi:hypothetical protein GCM10011399_03220 [Subtercola lobariae]|uniref:Uncharacterized protein n=1 Tax=Subtercola lobariae TaxID=1588641 RepID=A0A917B167_9MICO|nr:hypothetical protein GCM10011399_03220 [Subtercola lobariae]